MSKAIVGNDPTTKRCEFVAIHSFDSWSENRNAGLIVVPATMEKSRAVFGKIADDVYALAAPNVNSTAG